MLEHGLAGMHFSPIYYLDGSRDSWLTSPRTTTPCGKRRRNWMDAVFNFSSQPGNCPNSDTWSSATYTLRQGLDLIRREIPFFTAANQEKILGRIAASLWGYAT